MLMAHKIFMTRSGKRYPENEVVGVAKNNNQVKGLSMRQKLQNSKGYAESQEFLTALGQSVATT